MRPQNQSERQSAIYRFWAIYIVVLLLPIVAFYFIFKNSSGGASSKDLINFERQIKEFERFAVMTKEIDSLSTKLIEIDQKLINRSTAESEKPMLDAQAEQVSGNLKKERETMERGLAQTQSKAVKSFLNSMPVILNNFLSYHNSFIRNVNLNKSDDAKDKEIADLKSESTKLNGEIGRLTAEVTGLKAQLAKK